MNTTPVFPVEARPNRATRRFTLSRRRQRKGQALILAVLVMLMIAVLSAGFLVVVSGNLNQTARVTDKTRAVESARSGLKFVNDQLTYSSLGEKWRPGFIPADYYAPTPAEKSLLGAGETSIPTQTNNGAATYGLYYSSVDIANGWAGRFAKFPDPLAPRSDAPQYLARVQRVAATNPTNDPDITDPTEADSQDPGKIGMLRITVIGLSNDDPAAFSKVVAYKGGQQSSPFGRYMLSVGNFDFKNNVVPVGQMNPAKNSTTTQLNLSDMQGQFPAAPFVVVVGNGTSTSPTRAGVVTSVSAANELTLAAPLSPPPSTSEKERVELAGQVGASRGLASAAVTPPTDRSAINFGSDNTFTDTALDISSTLNGNTSPGSMRLNGGADLVGDINALNLNGQMAQTQSNIQVSSLIALDATARNVNVSGTPKSGSGAAIPATTPKKLVSSSDPNFPFTTAAANATEQEDFNSLASDGFNRLNNDPSSLRQTQPFMPPSISSAAGAGRYRRLTRDSRVNPNSINPPVATPSDTAANYGYGEGIYINNPTDRERVYDGGKLRDMTQNELVKMWLSRRVDTGATPPKVVEDATNRFQRTSLPATSDPTDANSGSASLEEQHLRGWVAPDEFHARGALVELLNEAQDPTQPVSPLNPIVAKVAITLDSRTDNITANRTNAIGPVASKVWAKPNGNPDPGVYRKVFNWPTNGVIFAEGNVRVRGEIDATVGAAPRSLTIVSQNNIYIDGSLNAAKNGTGVTPKILLLARRNVVVNPTQAIFRPEAQTLATQAVTVPGFVTPTPGQQPVAVNVSVYDTNDFKAGDVIETLTPATSATTAPTLNAVGVVTNVDATNKTLAVVSLQTADANVSANDIVRIRAEKAVNGRAVINSLTDAIQRRFQVSDPTNFRLTFDHSASKINALAVSAEAVTPLSNSGDRVDWTFKRTTDASGNVVPSEKVARATFKSPLPGGTEVFPDAALPSDNATANGTTHNLTAIAAAMIAKPPHTDATVSWKYNAAVNTPYAQVPFHYLVALRNRQTFGAPATPATDYNVDIRVPNPQTTPYQMNLATSIDPLWNGQPVSMRGLDPAPDVAHNSFFFGFCPDYKEITFQSPQVAEDGLTSDEAFYQADANQTTLDSRVPYNSATAPAPFVQAAGIYSLSLHEPAGVVGISDAGTTPAPLPQYRLGRVKMEQLDTASKTVKPGYTMGINAFVYAQTGSWFVIPTAIFDKTQYKGTDLNATASVFDAGGSKDFNRNGSDTDAGEADAFLRYSRTNYKINFTGAIAENQSALVNSIGTIPGAVQAWSNDWASYTETNGTVDTSATSASPGVVYKFDPSYAANQLDPNDSGFVMPQSDQLTYVE